VETLRIRHNDLANNLANWKYNIHEEEVIEPEEETESKYLNLFDDGWTDMDLYCVSWLWDTKNGYQELIWYYLTKDGLKYKNPAVADVWLEEQAWWYGCLVANMKVWYCSYLPEINMNDNKPWMVWGNISSDFSEKALDYRYGDDRKAPYYYCNELSEIQKYNQNYTIWNVMSLYEKLN
jgi:hypothetical protein